METRVYAAPPVAETYRGSDGVVHQSESRINLHVNGGNRPVISGETDAPDGTALMISVIGPVWADFERREALGLPTCKPICNFYSSDGLGVVGTNATVSKGRFVTPPILGFNHSGLPDGIFEIIVEEFEQSGPSLSDDKLLKARQESRLPFYKSAMVVTSDHRSFQVPYGCSINVGLTNGCRQ
jgi:hypothetical protein